MVYPFFWLITVGWRLRKWRGMECSIQVLAFLALGACLWRPQQVLKWWFKMLTINGINLRCTVAIYLTETRKFSYSSGFFQLLLALENQGSIFTGWYTLTIRRKMTYRGIWGKCICPGSKFAIRYALCWSFAEIHIWWQSNSDSAQKKHMRQLHHDQLIKLFSSWLPNDGCLILKLLQGHGYKLLNFWHQSAKHQPRNCIMISIDFIIIIYYPYSIESFNHMNFSFLFESMTS